MDSKIARAGLQLGWKLTFRIQKGQKNKPIQYLLAGERGLQLALKS